MMVMMTRGEMATDRAVLIFVPLYAWSMDLDRVGDSGRYTSGDVSRRDFGRPLHSR